MSAPPEKFTQTWKGILILCEEGIQRTSYDFKSRFSAIISHRNAKTSMGQDSTLAKPVSYTNSKSPHFIDEKNDAQRDIRQLVIFHLQGSSRAGEVTKQVLSKTLYSYIQPQ